MNKHLIGAFLISGAALLFFVLVMPKFNELSAAQATLDQRSQLRADSRQAQAAIAQLSQQYDEAQASIQKVYTALPKNRQVDYITSSISAAAQQSGLELKALVLGDAPSAKGEYDVIQIRLDVRGRYASMMFFLKNLEASLRLYDVEKLDVAETSGSDGLLAITMTLHAYSIRKP